MSLTNQIKIFLQDRNLLNLYEECADILSLMNFERVCEVYDVNADDIDDIYNVYCLMKFGESVNLDEDPDLDYVNEKISEGIEFASKESFQIVVEFLIGEGILLKSKGIVNNNNPANHYDI